MRRTITWLGTLLLLTVPACRDAPTVPPTDEAPTLAISDGAHAGNPHAFFLPPMVPDASSQFSAAFDGTLDVAIHICVWNTATEACGPALEMYNRNAGPGAETVRVSAEDESYGVNWKTDHILEEFPLGANEVYRIRVLVAGQVVAYADVEVVGTARELRNVNTAEFIPLLDGRTLPIRVRIEEGWEGYSDPQLISAGGLYSCGIAESGKAYCWGSNWAGQLGTGNYVSSAIPVEVAGEHTFVSLGTGSEYACGLRTDGAVYCWGFTSYGGTVYYGPTPVAVPGGRTFRLLRVGSYHACGIADDGLAYCWGNNVYGQLGAGSGVSASPTPLPVLGGHAFEDISPVGFHTCGLTTDGAAYCWGYNADGQLGLGNYSYGQTTPAQVVGGRTFVNLRAGGYHTCAVDLEDRGYCWGANYHSELGSSLGQSRNVPTPVAGNVAFASIRPGGYHTCAIARSGEAYCWGYNVYGQVGNGVSSYIQPTPAPVAGGRLFIDLIAGYMHTCGLTATDEAVCWGWNGYGQLGTGNYVTANAPVSVVQPPGGW